MHPLRAADVQGFERFADLVRVTVVKLQAEGKVGELGDGTLYSLLVKKLTGHQLEIYTRWMNEHSKDRSVLSLRDWLKEEVSIRVEAIEMAHGIESKILRDIIESNIQRKVEGAIQVPFSWLRTINAIQRLTKTKAQNKSLLVPSVAGRIMVFGLVDSLNKDRWNNDGTLPKRNSCVFAV
ncbi:Hypothetical predicted protein [Paramuricea clavata]|uniref:Uncharacterized protein n=1 Tax=Paramuricea clavata TaxID=317549 RepID=A0A6S7FZH9_PARCT|nr:Hypothetical predicted protein [Paramuricea clavata]